MIKIIVENNINCCIDTLLPLDVLQDISMACSFELAGSEHSPKVVSGVWDGYINLFKEKTQRFPAGLLSQVAAVLQTHKIDYSIEDKRTAPNYKIQAYDLVDVCFYAFQKTAIETALKKQRGIIHVATGGGKSVIIAALCLALSDLNVCIFVHRNTLMRQLETLLNKNGVSVGIVGDGEKRIRKINICSFQTILHNHRGGTVKLTQKNVEKMIHKDHLKLIRDAEVLIVDESHHISANLFKFVTSLTTNAFFRFGFSATPYREDGRELLLHSGLGKTIVKHTPSNLIQLGILEKPNVIFIKVPKFPGLGRDYRKAYKKAIVENSLRNEMIVQAAVGVCKKNKTCLIAVKEIKHGQILFELLQGVLPNKKITYVTGASGDGVKKLEILAELNNRKLDIVIATTVFGEGVDVPTLGVLINAKGGASKIDTLQLCGRVLRKAKNYSKKPVIIDFYDTTTPYLAKHARTRLSTLTEEAEFIITKLDTITKLEEKLVNVYGV